MIHALEDAELLVAKTTVENHRIQKTVVIGDDIDVLVLLLHYCELDSYSLIYQISFERWVIYNLNNIKPDLIYSNLLQHAFLGCDTMSQISGPENKRLESSHQVQFLCHSVSSVFYSTAPKIVAG